MIRATGELGAGAVDVVSRPSPELDQDEEEAFEELVQALGLDREYPEAFVKDAGSEFSCFLDEFVREDEFTCHRCNLILNRVLLVDEERSLCGSCASQASRPGSR